MAKVYRLRVPLCAFLFLFSQVVLQKSWPKGLGWSVGIEPTLKG